MSVHTTRNIIFVLIFAYAVLLVGVRWYSIYTDADMSAEDPAENDLSVITVISPDAVSMAARSGEKESYLPDIGEGDWQAYSNQEKIKILLLVVEKESLELGFPAPRLQETDLEDRVLANYDLTNKVINIDQGHLEKSLFADNLNSILHEVRHAYQYELRNMLDFLLETAPSYADLAFLEKVKQIKENEDDYLSGLEDFEVYSSQLIEVDARFYAANRLKQLLPEN